MRALVKTYQAQVRAWSAAKRAYMRDLDEQRLERASLELSKAEAAVEAARAERDEARTFNREQPFAQVIPIGRAR